MAHDISGPEFESLLSENVNRWARVASKSMIGSCRPLSDHGWKMLRKTRKIGAGGMTSVFACSEDELVTLCARVSVGAVAAVRIRELLDAGIDWQRFVQAAIHHRVVPLVQRTLFRDFPGSVPRTIAEGLSDSCSALARRNLFLTAKLSRIVGQLESDGVRALAYKGPTLAVQVYGSLALRQFGDLDVLVDNSEYLRAREMLEAYGFALEADCGWECSFRDASTLVQIDLHRSFTPDQFPVALNFRELWERREYVSLLGRSVPTLSREDGLVVLCIQIVKDAWGGGAMRLSKVCDIAELIRSKPAVDRERVRKMSRSCGCRRVLEVGLGVCERLLGPMPEPAYLGMRADLGRTRLEDHIVARLFEPENRKSEKLISRNWFHFGIRERFRDKAYPHLRAFWLLLRPNERDLAMLRLPESMRWLYYLVRPIRLARDHFVRPVSRRV